MRTRSVRTTKVTLSSDGRVELFGLPLVFPLCGNQIQLFFHAYEPFLCVIGMENDKKIGDHMQDPA